uniref:Uncharacterized protein n=1 Tax=Takifugu rubripes TaxID=31033 RepID=A0A674NGK8_TAKRU
RNFNVTGINVTVSLKRNINKPTMWTWKIKNTINKLFPLAFIKVKGCRRTNVLREFVGDSSRHAANIHGHRSKGSFIPNSLCNLYITLKVPVFNV